MEFLFRIQKKIRLLISKSQFKILEIKFQPSKKWLYLRIGTILILNLEFLPKKNKTLRKFLAVSMIIL